MEQTPVQSPSPGRHPSESRVGRGDTFRSLRKHPNFRLYWVGAGLSNIGTWMQLVAQGWLVFQLTNSAFLLGLVSFVGSIPVLVLSLYGGVLADRVERRRLMMVTQTGMMLLAFVLAGLTFVGLVTVWHIMAIAFLNGCVNAINAPVRASLVADLVPRDDFQNAIALNSVQFQGSRMVGPALAGLTLGALGPGWCFLINGISFLTVIAALIGLKVPPLPPRPAQSVLQNVKEALQYVWREPTIFALLLVAAIPSLFGQPYQAMLPAVAIGVLAMGATGLGILTSAAGCGAVVGALLIASSTGRKRRGKLQLQMLLLFGIALGVFSQTRSQVIAAPIILCVGLASMAYNSLNQTFLQSLVTDEMRGRVTSLLTLMTLGLQPLGALQAGVVAERLGVSTALLAGGIICALVGLVAQRYRRGGLDELT